MSNFRHLSIWPESANRSIRSYLDGSILIGWSSMQSRIICISNVLQRTITTICHRLTTQHQRGPYLVSAPNEDYSAFEHRLGGLPFDWPHYIVVGTKTSVDAPDALIIDSEYRGRTTGSDGKPISKPMRITIVIFPGIDVHTEMAKTAHAYNCRVRAEVQKIGLPLVLSAIVAEYATDFEGWALNSS